ncbi:hypothetical protein R8Z57_07385 [Microbacterium sp. M3]|uniref:DUF600 family protein n=1 Tax=Microbacterium arthrosphaerae TaxID=792652 RepID=A0ABU4GZV0_9MICO|nr:MULTISPECIES: hypothetical protein [Microbacterium]MDW4572601.1 hypothetical protein [Microbacterium arthrosphaerae]MDW7606456.1 hypothetical protein [Microbacterium sp. M3]
MSEQAILQELVSAWVSLGLEYANDAPDVSALFVYASSEPSHMYAEFYFEQRGMVVYPSDLAGISISVDRIRRVHDLQIQDLEAAEQKFASAGIPAPTEYKIYYEPSTRKLDVQLSRDLIYTKDEAKTPVRGIEYWLGDRAPKLY